MTNTTRRTILAGLAAAPVAGLPALAGAVAAADPALAAIADWERSQVHVKMTGEAHTIADTATFSDEFRFYVEVDGEKLYRHEHIDAHFADKGLSEEEIERILTLRRHPLSPEEQAARDAAKQAAHDELGGILEKIVKVRAKANFEAAEEAWNRALDGDNEAQKALVETAPTTPVGAFALLRFLADNLDDLIDDARERAPDAIRAAVAVLEREALA